MLFGLLRTTDVMIRPMWSTMLATLSRRHLPRYPTRGPEVLMLRIWYGGRHEIVPPTAVLETQVRTGGDRDVRALVSALLLELARFGGVDGGAGTGRRSYDHLAVGPSLRPGNLSPLAGPAETKVFDLAHG